MSQVSTRCFHLGVPQTPVVSNYLHWTSHLLFPPHSNLSTVSPSNQELNSSFVPSLILSRLLSWSLFNTIFLIYFDLLSPSFFPMTPLFRHYHFDLEYFFSKIKTLKQFLYAFKNHHVTMVGLQPSHKLDPTCIYSFSSRWPPPLSCHIFWSLKR